LLEILDLRRLVYFLNDGAFIFIIGLTKVKIEYDYCAWERSFNPSSTASTVDVGFHLLLPLPPTFTPATQPRFLTTAIDPQVPLPSPEGCGPITVSFDGGQHRGREEEGEASER